MRAVDSNELEMGFDSSLYIRDGLGAKYVVVRAVLCCRQSRDDEARSYRPVPPFISTSEDQSEDGGVHQDQYNPAPTLDLSPHLHHA
jgi:hypothetical protein